MSSIDNALTTLARAKSFLEISGSSKDLILTMIILGASQYIQDSYLRRRLKRAVYTDELHDGRGTKRLRVKNGPIISGQTVTLQYRGSTSDDWSTISSDTYVVNYEEGYLEFTNINNAFANPGGGCFSEGIQNYRVTYTGGYYVPSDTQYQDGTDDNLDLPYDLEIAVLDFVAAMYNLRQTGGIKNQRVGEVSIEYASELDKHPTVKNTLDRYRVMQYA